MDRWRGTVAVVTGASAGIGKDVAEKLVEQGLIVAGLSRRVELIAEHASKLSGKAGKLVPFKCDVSNEDTVAEVFAEIKSRLGPIQILINNAGRVTENTFVEGDPKIWKDILATNLYGLSVCTHFAIKQMKEADLPGHIININSIAGHKVIDGEPNSSNMYAPSKHGVTAFTEVVRQELRYFKSNIKITSISPGLVGDTDIFEAGNFTTLNKEIVNAIAHLLPEDVTDAILYVLGTKPHVQVHELIIKPIGEMF